MNRVLGLLLVAAVAVSPAHGERNSQRRVQAFARLPDWSGLWETASSPMGDSVGRWKGATLIIDTVARTPGPFVLGSSIGLSEQAHFIERMRLVDRNTLEDQLTIEDPLRLAAPWKLTFRFTRVTDLDRMIPYDCEADRNPIVNGKIVIKPPDAPAAPVSSH